MKNGLTLTVCAGVSNSSPLLRPILKVPPGTKTIPAGVAAPAAGVGFAAASGVAPSKAVEVCVAAREGDGLVDELADIARCFWLVHNRQATNPAATARATMI